MSSAAAAFEQRRLAATPAPALVHDYLLVLRGAERTFAEIADCWQDAPIYTLLYDREATRDRFGGRVVHTSPLQRLRPSQRSFRRLMPLYPAAIKRLALEGQRLVISSSSAFAHGVNVAEGATHVCYCHSPFRYVWHERRLALTEVHRSLQPAMHLLQRGIRSWDIEASRRVTHYIANSRITQRRIQDFWGRDSVIIHPPVEVDRFGRAEPEDWFLMVGEVVRHKRVEVALEAAQRAGKRLKVVGTGPDLERLRARYAGTAEFLGRVGDDELAGLYARARALVMPNVEEFGIAGVEAQAAGRPVLAADAGGAQETVIEGETGHRVPTDNVGAFAEAMSYADFDRMDADAIVASAQRFSAASFRARMRAEVERVALGAHAQN
jgi:glycosyltransferase involved in cell wall biosynthesis